MASRNSLDSLATSIAGLGRNEVIRRISNFKGRFKLDFSREYLDNLSLDKLRHVLLAAMATSCK